MGIITRIYCIKMAEHIEILSLSGRTVILVFHHQGLLHKSDDFAPSRGADCRIQGDSDFRPICGYISETVIYKSILTIEEFINYSIVRF